MIAEQRHIVAAIVVGSGTAATTAAAIRERIVMHVGRCSRRLRIDARHEIGIVVVLGRSKDVVVVVGHRVRHLRHALLVRVVRLMGLLVYFHHFVRIVFGGVAVIVMVLIVASF